MDTAYQINKGGEVYCEECACELDAKLRTAALETFGHSVFCHSCGEPLYIRVVMDGMFGLQHQLDYVVGTLSAEHLRQVGLLDDDAEWLPDWIEANTSYFWFDGHLVQ